MADEIVIPYTFTGGLSAKAQEVNANFQQVRIFCNELAETNEVNTRNIAQLNTNKANVSGDESNVFNVASPIGPYHAVNLSYLERKISIIKYAVYGLHLTLTGVNTITLSPGGCYDSNFVNPIENNTNLTSIYENLTPLTTYAIFILSTKSSPTNTSMQTLEDGNTPIISDDDIIYRRIGHFIVDSLGNVGTITEERD